MGRRTRDAPSSYSSDWPDVACDDPVAEGVRQVVINLTAATSGRSVRDVASAAGLDHSVLHDLLRGNSWPQAATVLRIEHGLGVDLWPRQTGE